MRRIFADTQLFMQKLIVLPDGKGCRGSETLAMFKLPAYDPFAITVMGFGVALAAVLVFAAV